MLNKAVIDLSAIRENTEKVKRYINGKSKLFAVVKADAYGHGLIPVASAIYSLVDGYAVATVEEGKNLRLGGIDKDILVFFPPNREDLESSIEYGLIYSATKKAQIDMISFYAKKSSLKAKIHLKFDTGMNRLGVRSLEELKYLVEYSLKKGGIILDGAYSHIGQFQNKRALKESLDKFLLANNLVKGYNNINCHISASGGLLKGITGDIVRVGILLYGYKPFNSREISVRPAMKVFSPVLDKKNLLKGDMALYGDYTLKRDKTATIVGYGYADGLMRASSKNLINNRCMNISAYSKIIEKDGYALVMGDANELAQEYGTINYEILTKCAYTAQKIYLN